jgi:hypothetical protein
MLKPLALSYIPCYSDSVLNLVHWESVMPDEKQKEKIVVPWGPGPTGDEWDSPGYDHFWSPVERAVNQRILDAKAEGKK